MRSVIGCMSLITVISALASCGQTGALQLPSDPDYDKRAKYLLHSDSAEKAPQNSESAGQADVVAASEAVTE